MVSLSDCSNQLGVSSTTRTRRDVVSPVCLGEQKSACATQAFYIRRRVSFLCDDVIKYLKNENIVYVEVTISTVNILL